MGERVRLGRLARRAFCPTELSPTESRLLRQHLTAALFNGILLGSMNLGDVTLAKTLGGSPFAVTALNLLIGISYLGSLFFAGMMRGRPKAPFILLFAVVGRLGMWLLALSPRPGWFIFVLGLAWLSHSLILVGQVSIIQRAYAAQKRTILFGLTLSMTTAFNLIASVALGWLLQWKEGAYAIYYGVAGVAGFLGALYLGRMERALDRLQGVPAGGTSAVPGSVVPAAPGAGGAAAAGGTASAAKERAIWRAWSAETAGPAYRPMGQPGLGAALRSMRQSVRLVLSILHEDARYRRFQNNFFLYGVAFLCITPVVPLFLVHDLQLDYRQIGLAKGLMGQAGMILFPPLLGRLMERLGPIRFSGRMFAFLAFYPLLLLFAGIGPAGWRLPLTYLAFLCFGTSMAGVNLAWHMSSLHFAGREDPSSYQAVHTFLTGLRGGFAPLLGYLLILTGTKSFAFAVSAALLGWASLLMGRMAAEEEALAAVGTGRPSPAGGAGAAPGMD